jgi:hypothetical protein
MEVSLRKNQIDAIKISLENDFSSGVHFHATGTGKSLIALKLVLEFEKRNPLCNILWICEQKSILYQQFSRKSNISKELYETFLVYNYCDNKDPEWFKKVKNSYFWKKPSLIVINRAYLTSANRYEELKIPIHLVIHDECHSIKNKTTQIFYKWLLEKYPDVKCIGFSATPNTQFKPFQNLLSKFSIYEAFSSDIILPPRVVWYKSSSHLEIRDITCIVKREIEKLPYKKIVVWCGIIEDCYRIVEEWKGYFEDYKIYIDTSLELDSKNIEEFYKLEEKGFLFCACKHREGSDIPNLDGCIFLDKVEDRCPKTFIQCIGRVLRKDPMGLKKYGLVLDLKARSCMDIINRIHPFLYLETKIFPWKHTSLPLKVNSKQVILQELNMLRECELVNSSLAEEERDYSSDEIKGLFVRHIDFLDLRYHQRLEEELKMFEDKKLFQYLVRALEILKLTENIPHVTRGSCGSSLVCYLLGISHIDPIRYNITFSRFLNEFRNTLPDIDFDFPYNVRKDVFLKIEEKYPGKVARISNHVYYHEKSALREAIRTVGGVKSQISKYELNKVVRAMNPLLKHKVYQRQKHLEDSFRTYSLHCGGIIFYPDGIPEDKILEKTKHSLVQQVTLNKEEVSKEKHFKIDILSSRALAIVQSVLGDSVSFERPILDPNVFLMLSNGDNIGITLAESPLMRKTFLTIQPKSIEDLAICLAIIRPAARKAKAACGIDMKTLLDMREHFIFDDDAILKIAEILKCSEGEADRIRRVFAKGDAKGIKEFRESLKKLPMTKSQKHNLLESLEDLSQYSFCKSHAFSYAQLVYQLAYIKYHKPLEFWKATLEHSHSSYKKWVHRYEARIAGVEMVQSKEVSIYAQNRRKKIQSIDDPYKQINLFGYWRMDTTNFFPDCYFKRTGRNTFNVRGLISSTKVFQADLNKEDIKIKTIGSSSAITNTIVLFLGVAPKCYVEIKINNLDFVDCKYIGATFEAALLDTKYNDNYYVLTAQAYRFF